MFRHIEELAAAGFRAEARARHLQEQSGCECHTTQKLPILQPEKATGTRAWNVPPRFASKNVTAELLQRHAKTSLGSFSNVEPLFPAHTQCISQTPRPCCETQELSWIRRITSFRLSGFHLTPGGGCSKKRRRREHEPVHAQIDLTSDRGCTFELRGHTGEHDFVHPSGEARAREQHFVQQRRPCAEKSYP